MRKSSLILVPLTALCLHCGGGAAPAPDEPLPEVPEPTAGGGEGGEPFAGSLDVFALTEDGAPIAGATVLVEGPAPIQAATGSDGRATFQGLRELRGVHVFADGRRYTSLLGARRSVLTLVLLPRKASERPAARAQVEGRVLGLERLAPATPARARLALVTGLGESFTQDPRAGSVTPDDPDGLPANLVLSGAPPFPRWEDFALAVDAASPLLVAWGGTFTPGAAQPVEYTHLGLRRAMRLAPEETAGEQDVELLHPLSQMINASWSGRPSLQVRRLRFGLILAEGTVPLAELDLTKGGAPRAQAPALEGELAGASYQAELVSESSRLYAGQPRQAVYTRARAAASELALGAPLAPLGLPTAAVRSVAAPAAAGAELHRFLLGDEASGEVLWSVDVLGEDGAFTLPAVPAGHADPLVGARSCEVRAYDLADGTAIPLTGLEDRARSLSLSRGRVTF